jgi:uncharacterized membrane protein (Fun14 family)
MLNEGPGAQPIVQVQQTSLADSIKNAFQPETIAHKLGIDKNTLIDIGIYGAIGFIVGFLLKKYSEYFIACVLFVGSLMLLQQFEYITIAINTAKIHEVLGIPSIPLMNIGYSSLVVEWMKSHVPASASVVVGFLIGMKVG